MRSVSLRDLERTGSLQDQQRACPFVTVLIHRIYYNQFNKTKASHKEVTKNK